MAAWSVLPFSNVSVSLSNGPRPVVGTWAITNVTHGWSGGDYVITANDVTSAPDGFEWRVRSNGWMNLRYRYTLTGTQTWFGVTFDYPETNVTAMRWLGQGRAGQEATRRFFFGCESSESEAQPEILRP